MGGNRAVAASSEMPLTTELLCTTVLLEVVVCNDHRACVLDVASWVHGRSGPGATQKVRSWSILKPAFLGEPCTDQPLEETAGCQRPVTECLTLWSPG